MGCPTNSAELRAELNAIASDPAWRDSWTKRGYDVGEVRACIREMIARAAAREQAGDAKGFQGWARHTLDYAQGKLLDEIVGDAYEGPIGPGMRFRTYADDETAYSDPPARRGDPQEEDYGGVQLWLDVLSRCHDQTFRYAIAMFKRRHDFWPNPHWPGMPRNPLDKGRKICKVPPDKCIPLPE
jgi:hypothetical protein